MSATDNSPAVPAHVAIIMDGNNRWARRNVLKPYAGHKAGVETIRDVLDALQQAGVRVVTLFAFSSENWRRPSAEVNALMTLFSSYLDSEIQKLNEDGVRLRFIGRRDRLSKTLLRKMEYAEQSTRANKSTHLNIAVDYGGQWDIVQAAQTLAVRVKAGDLEPVDIDEALFDRETALGDLPKPDLCIRTAGEQRISNFMLWQMAYAEFYFSEALWPDFDADEVRKALDSYAERERRFGGRHEDESPQSSPNSHTSGGGSLA